MNSRLNIRHACLKTVTSPLQIFFKHAAIVERLLRFRAVVVPHEKLLPLFLTHLIHTIIRDVGDWNYVYEGCAWFA